MTPCEYSHSDDRSRPSPVLLSRIARSHVRSTDAHARPGARGAAARASVKTSLCPHRAACSSRPLVVDSGHDRHNPSAGHRTKRAVSRRNQTDTDSTPGRIPVQQRELPLFARWPCLYSAGSVVRSDRRSRRREAGCVRAEVGRRGPGGEQVADAPSRAGDAYGRCRARRRDAEARRVHLTLRGASTGSGARQPNARSVRGTAETAADHPRPQPASAPDLIMNVERSPSAVPLAGTAASFAKSRFE
jgi:hypothetical protein